MTRHILSAIVIVGVVVGVTAGFTVEAVAEVSGMEVSYSAAGTTLKGYLAVDKKKEGKRPGILVVHEWWGHNEYARKRARMLAKLGYVAFAVDMYGDGRQAMHPDDAGKFATEVRKNMDVGRARFRAAMDVLKEHPMTDPSRIAAIGYCFGGSIVLQMARDGMDLKGVVSFHGSLTTDSPAKPGKVKARVLVFSGEDDPMIPPAHTAAFKEEMTKAGADFRCIIYPGVEHSFTNPEADKYAEKFGLPLKYDEEADEDSWNEMKKFLATVFK